MLLDLSGKTFSSLRDTNHIALELSNLGMTIEDVTDLNVSGCHLEDLLGVDLFPNLVNLDASNNNISLLDPLVPLNLSRIKLDHNNFEYLYVKELKNGKVVLSSDGDMEYTESLMNLVPNGKKSNQPPDEDGISPGYVLVDLSFNKIKHFQSKSTKKLEIKLMDLSNNMASDFSGLESISGLCWLDLSNNKVCNVTSLMKCGLTHDCEIFMQDTELLNDQLLEDLLDMNTGLVVEC